MAQEGKLLLFQTRAERQAAKWEKIVERSEMIRAKTCADNFFPDQPVLSEYLLRAVMKAHGSFHILRLICLALQKAFPNQKDDVSLETVQEMSLQGSLGATERLVRRYRDQGSLESLTCARELAFKLQGDPIPQKKVPRSEWIMATNDFLKIEFLPIYARTFICAYIMLLATHEEKRKTHAA